MDETDNLKTELKKRLSALPKVLQDAITSADIDKQLRALSVTHKLHLDQWEKLENEVVLSLLGIQHVEDLEKNIQQEVGISQEVARQIAESISLNIFEPIRQELERQLEHPAAQEKEVSDIEAARTEQLHARGEVAATSQAPIFPATPPLPAPEIKVVRPSESSTYKPGEASSTRAVVHDDPYRVPPV